MKGVWLLFLTCSHFDPESKPDTVADKHKFRAELQRRFSLVNGVLAQLLERLNGINARLIFSNYPNSL
jgi:hypothetical protein